MKFNKIVFSGLVTAAMLAIGGTANATLIVTESNTSPGASNVLHNACGAISSAQGCLNTNHSVVVDFTSSTDVVNVTGGQAVITAADGYLNQLTLSLAGGDTFESLVLDLQPGNITGNPSDIATVTFTNDLGDISQTFNLGDGSNYFTLTGGDFTSISFSSDAGIAGISLDLKQVRIDGIHDPHGTPIDIPEPASLALLGIGLLGLSSVSRRRRTT
jgi:hypothetical protein